MKNVFKFTNMSLGLRLFIGAVLLVLCSVLQAKFSSFLIGLPFIVGLYLLWFLKPVTNKPNDRGLEEWREVDESAVNVLVDRLAQSEKLGRVSGKKIGCLAFMIVIIAVGIVGIVEDSTDMMAVIMLADIPLFFLPSMFFGNIKTYTPELIKLKIASFIQIMSVPLPEGFKLIPYFRFDKDENGLDLPEDLRFMLVKKTQPADLIGVQIQASINKVQSASYPYMYAVFLLNDANSAALAKYKNIKLKGYVVEADTKSEYPTVVLRQETAGNGYHTTEKQCTNLLEHVLRFI